MTPLYVLAGTGGVGKTTHAAAMGLGLACDRRVLVVTVDPARRLADALGVPESREPVAVGGGLSIWMPDVESVLDRLVAELMPSSMAIAFRNNLVTEALRRAPAGMHEVLVSLALAGLADRYDAIVLDTAPSQQGLDFLDTPRRLRGILEQRALDWLASFGTMRGSRATRLVERAVARIIPIDVIKQAAAFFTALLSARSELAQRAAIAEAMLDHAQYFVVAAPDEASVEGALHLHTVLRMRRTPVRATILNRAPSRAIEQELDRARSAILPSGLADAIDAIEADHAFGLRAAMHAAARLGAPWVVAERFGSPREIVDSIAVEIASRLFDSDATPLSA